MSTAIFLAKPSNLSFFSNIKKKNHGLRNRDPWQAITQAYQGSSVLNLGLIFDCLPLFLVLGHFSGKR
jgi:hypothetical protein